MVETLLCILAAGVTIIVASLLIKWQKNQEEKTQKLDDELKEHLDEAVQNYIILTNKNANRKTPLRDMKKDISKLYANYIAIPDDRGRVTYKERKSRYVKCKKGFADD